MSKPSYDDAALGLLAKACGASPRVAATPLAHRCLTVSDPVTALERYAETNTLIGSVAKMLVFEAKQQAGLISKHYY